MMAKFPTIEEFAKSVADKVLDDYEYEGKTIREWVELILKDELTEVVWCKDCKSWKRIRDDRGLCKHPTFTLDDDVIDPMTELNDFCSYGERREDDG